MTTVKIDGLEIEILQTGEGPLLLCVHGSLSDRRTWEATASHLNANRAVATYSRRFHWPNPAPENPEDYVPETHTADLAAVAKALSDEPLDIVGHGYGGFVSLELACQQPDLVRRLVVMEPPVMALVAIDRPKYSDLLRLLRTHPELGFHIAKYQTATLRPARRAAEQRRMEKAAYVYSEGLLGKTAFGLLSDDRWDQVLDNTIRAEFLKTLFPPLDHQTVEAITTPTLVLSGNESPSLWRLLGDHLAALLPNSERAAVNHAGYLAHEDRPIATATVIEEFLAS